MTGAVGTCHTVVWTPTDGATWSGVAWQYPANNWGTMGGGLAIPAGATKITFYAKGALGTETVAFSAGFVGTAACADPVSATTGAPITLTTTWTQYSMPLTNPTGGAVAWPDGMVNAFTYVVTPSAGVGGDAGGDAGADSETFYIDDIQWVM